MKRLNIAMVSACPFPANRGTPSRILRMSEGLKRLGHNINVITYHFGDNIQLDGIKLYRIPKLTRYNNFSSGPTITKLILLDPLLLLTLLNVIKTKNIDIIHGHHFEGALIGYGARALTGIRVVYDAHTTLTDELQHYKLWNHRMVAKYLDYHVPKWADFNIAVSNTLKNKLYHIGIPGTKIDVVPTGVNAKQFEAANPSRIYEKYGIKSKKVVIYTGSLEEFQNVPYLLEAMSLVVKQIDEAILLVVGNGNVDKYAGFCHSLGIQEKVIFAKELSFREIPNYLSAAEVAVLPRINCPGMPQKLTNYMMARKAIVSFEGSAKLLSHGVNGLIVSNGDIEKMSLAIIRLLQNRKLRKNLGHNARATAADKYDWDILSKKIERIYFDLLR